MSADSLDLWVELPSPLKISVKNAFFDFAKKVYEKNGRVISSYFPSVMGGDMPKEDYLINMSPEKVPENYLAMAFGESSSPVFYRKFIETGLYRQRKTVAWFCETMVVDVKRLGHRPLPASYFDLVNPCYKGEVCIIGTPEIPDPLLPLFIQKKLGKKGSEELIKNIAGFGAPVNAIRHIGKSSNHFGSIFVMPLLFANVCRKLKNALVIEPEEGLFAEPFVLFSKNPDDEKSRLIQDFFSSPEFEEVLKEKDFLSSSVENDRKISPLCRDFYFPEIEEIYQALKKALEEKIP